LKSCCLLQDNYDDERDKTVFHNTTQHQTCKSVSVVGFSKCRDIGSVFSVFHQDRFVLDSDWSCPKTDGLRPHHWFVISDAYSLMWIDILYQQWWEDFCGNGWVMGTLRGRVGME